MKRSFGLGLAALSIAIAAPLVFSTPSMGWLQSFGTALAQQIRRPEVKLVLEVEKQVPTVDEQGNSKLVWQGLTDNATVHPGDVLRYTIASSNNGEMAAQNLLITQPIPAEMQYVLDSAKGNEQAQITYSIDKGETFVAEPMVEVTQPDGTVTLEPAPAESYTHIRWDFGSELAPAVAVNVNYEVAVK
jgi:uncharacterized repeat protein (TIGR01451 family)